MITLRIDPFAPPKEAPPDPWASGLRRRIEKARLQPLDSQLRGFDFGVHEGEIVPARDTVVDLRSQPWESEAEWAARMGVVA